MTSGFDSQLINTLRFFGPFNAYFDQGYRMLQVKPPSNLPFLESSLPATSLVLFLLSLLLLGSTRSMVEDDPSCLGPALWLLVPSYGEARCQKAGSTHSCEVGMYIVARILLGYSILFAIISGSFFVRSTQSSQGASFLA